MDALNVEQRRAVEEGLTEDQLALFDLVQRADLTKTDRERIKQASKELLAGVLKIIATLDHWTEKKQTQAEVETFTVLAFALKLLLVSGSNNRFTHHTFFNAIEAYSPHPSSIPGADAFIGAEVMRRFLTNIDIDLDLAALSRGSA